MLGKKYIRLSISLYATLVLIIKKSNEKLHIYVDYRALNVLIIKNRNASSLIRETIIKLYTIKVFIKFDIITIFNEIRIIEEDKKKIAFFIRYRLFKYTIISFSLYNALSTF